MKDERLVTSEKIDCQSNTKKQIAVLTLQRPVFTATLGQQLLDQVDEAEHDDAIVAIIVTGVGQNFCVGADLKNTSHAFNTAPPSDDLQGSTDTGIPYTTTSLNKNPKQNDKNPQDDPSAPNPAGRAPQACEERASQACKERVPQACEERDSFAYEEIGGKIVIHLLRCRKPIIGAINGHCIGMGACLSLGFTLRVVLGTAKIGFVFAKRGLSPVGCASYLLPKIVGLGKANEWILSGRIFPAKQEAASGLFCRIEEDAQDVMGAAVALASEMAQNSPLSVAICKGLLTFPLFEVQRAHQKESEFFKLMLAQPDFQEGVVSFLERRPANFKSSVFDLDISSKL